MPHQPGNTAQCVDSMPRTAKTQGLQGVRIDSYRAHHRTYNLLIKRQSGDSVRFFVTPTIGEVELNSVRMEGKRQTAGIVEDCRALADCVGQNLVKGNPRRFCTL